MFVRKYLFIHKLYLEWIIAQIILGSICVLGPVEKILVLETQGDLCLHWRMEGICCYCNYNYDRNTCQGPPSWVLSAMDTSPVAMTRSQECMPGSQISWAGSRTTLRELSPAIVML